MPCIDVVRNYLARPPKRWQRATAVVMGLVLPIALVNKRGWLVGVVAAAVYGGMGLAFAFKWNQVSAWSANHPVVDSAFLMPLTFLALAYVTTLPTIVCALIGVGLWLAITVLRQAVGRGRRRV